MSANIRLAGRGSQADGTRLAWSVADGRRGRRWRTVAMRDGELRHALLLEIGPDGLLKRLELTTADGLLTLHPDSAELSLHGNAVTVTGVRHLAFGWSGDHALAIDAEPVADAVTAHRLARSVGVGEGRSVSVVIVAHDLTVHEGLREFERISATRWRIDGEGMTRSLSIDRRGLLVGLDDARTWPLELDLAE